MDATLNTPRDKFGHGESDLSLLAAPELEATAIMLALATSEVGEDFLARWIREHSRAPKFGGSAA